MGRGFAAHLEAAADTRENAGQLDTGWRGYFTGKALHITKEERAASTAR